MLISNIFRTENNTFSVRSILGQIQAKIVVNVSVSTGEPFFYLLMLKMVVGISNNFVR